MNRRQRQHPGATAILFALLAILSEGLSVARCEQYSSLDGEAMARLKSPPLGLPTVPLPTDNPVTLEKISLGRKLFFDRRLSKNGTMSCGMCHIPEQGFTNNELATPVGVNGKSVRRNSPTILNSAYLRQLFLDGREPSLEKQAVRPLFAHDEMGNESEEELLSKLSQLEDYEGRFEHAFGAVASVRRIGQAIASWERTLLAADSPFDRWRYGGQQGALDSAQKRGFDLFVGKARCVRCHSLDESNTLFTDHSYHNTGIGYVRDLAATRSGGLVAIEIAPDRFVSVPRKLVAQVGDPWPKDLGRYEVTSQPEHKWQYRTPSLRNVAVTAPYMHDGSIPTLEAVVRYYSRGGAAHEQLDSLIEPIGLNEDEIVSLVAFLHSLTANNLGVMASDARAAIVGN